MSDRERISAITHGTLAFHNPLEPEALDEVLAHVVLGARVTSLRIEGALVVGVETSAGFLPAQTVIASMASAGANRTGSRRGSKSDIGPSRLRSRKRPQRPQRG